MPAARSTASRKAEAEIDARPVNVRPINGFIGAEIEGIDLRQPLSRPSSRSCTTRWCTTK